MPCLTRLFYNPDSLKHRELLACFGLGSRTDHLESVIEAEYKFSDKLSSAALTSGILVLDLQCTVLLGFRNNVKAFNGTRL